MLTEFVNVGPAGYDIWATTIGKYRINVTKSHSNLNPFVFEMILAEDEYTDIVEKGFGPDLKSTMHKAVTKAAELKKVDDANDDLLAVEKLAAEENVEDTEDVEDMDVPLSVDAMTVVPDDEEPLMEVAPVVPDDEALSV